MLTKMAKLRYLRSIMLACLYLLLSASPSLSQMNEEFKEKALSLKWIAYAPTNYNPDQGTFPDEDSMRQDLARLIKYGFSGIVTYGSQGTLSQIPRLAKEEGFLGVIMGIWDISDRDEIMNATLANPFVDAYCVGNEGLNCRYNLEAVAASIAEISSNTAKPATTSEQIFDYSNDSVIALGDWIFPNIHPFLNQIKDPEKGVRWIRKHYDRLKKHSGDKIILFKEVGFPTTGAYMANEANQKKFFLGMEKTGIAFVYFEAFDQFWKTSLPIEAHWGLFNSDRKPKKFISSR